MTAFAALLLVGGVVAVFPGISSRKRHECCGNYGAALRALKTIATSQALFREGDKDGDGLPGYGTLGELASPLGQSQGLVDPILGSGTRQGYFFRCEPDLREPESRWFAIAWPTQIGVTETRVLYTDERGEIFTFELVGH